jgi:ACS family hexuronate transporter-like MFS transporter
LRRVRHFSMAEIGYFAWIPFLAADAGCIAGGLVSGWLIRLGWRPVPARKAVMAVSAVAMLAGIPAVLADESAVALALISIVTFSYSMYSANILALATDLFPQEVVASVTGLGGTGAALGGMAFNLLVGVVVDRFSYVPVFVLAGIMPLLAVAGIFAGIRNRSVLASRSQA